MTIQYKKISARIISVNPYTGEKSEKIAKIDTYGTNPWHIVEVIPIIEVEEEREL